MSPAHGAHGQPLLHRRLRHQRRRRDPLRDRAHVRFKDFAELYPDKFQNKTNGVTPRRWLAFCNPQLSGVITEAIGTDEWVTDTMLLEKLAPLAKDADLQKKWKDAKQERKALCAKLIEDSTGVKVSTTRC